MIETSGIGSKRKLLIEHYSEFMAVLNMEGENVFSAGVETHGEITYFCIVLNR